MLKLSLGCELFHLLYSYDKRGGLDDISWQASKFYNSLGSEDDKTILSRYGAAGLGARQAVFHSACIDDGMSYLYSHLIAYRDMTPENELINSKGILYHHRHGICKDCAG